MANINMNELTQEQIIRMMNCETAEELMAVAKEEGYELTHEEAEQLMAKFENFELSEEALKNVAGGDPEYLKKDWADRTDGEKAYTVLWYATIHYNACVTGDTLLMLQDGSEKRADELAEQDSLMTWDFDRGMAVGRKMFFLHRGTYDKPHTVVRVKFDDGTSVGVVEEHLFFDLTLGRFIAINEWQPEKNRSFIGHAFAKVARSGEVSTVKLREITYTEKTYAYYAPIAEEHWSHMVNGMFSGCARSLGMVNRFAFVKGELRYDAEKKQADLKKYGRLPYDVLADYFSYEVFKKNRWDEMSVAIAKGLLTEDELVGVIAEFEEYFFDEKRLIYTTA